VGLKLIAELGLDGSGFASGLRKAEGLAQSAGHGIRDAIVGMVGIGTVGLAIHRTVESATELVNASQRLGVGVTNLQVLRKAAMDAGTEFGKLEKTFERIDMARRAALTPGSEGSDQHKAFARLGISPEMLRSMTASQLFMGPMSQAFKGGNAEQLGPLLRQLGLKDFGAMIPVLKTNFEELAAEMKKYGGIMDTETAVKLKHLGDEFSLVGNIITAQLGPALIKLTEWMYLALLKLGGGLAGAAAAAGAGTAKMGAGEQAVAYAKITGAGFADIFARVFKGRTEAESKKYMKAAAAAAGFNVKAMEGATATAKAPWEGAVKGFEDLLAKFAKEAKALDNQKPPEEGFTGTVQKRSVKSLEVPADSLTRVGNFLGGSQNAIMRLAEQRTQFLRQIAANTAPRGRTGGSSLGNPNAVFCPTH
jgi:hypothetical protein